MDANSLRRGKSGLRKTIRILSHHADLNTNQIETDYWGGIGRDGSESDRSTPDGSAPWVRIGNLYVSTLQTNSTHWGRLVEQLHREGKRSFHIFTGRHGDTVGSIVDDRTRTMDPVLTTDAHHLTEDKQSARVLASRLPGSSITVVNAGSPTWTVTLMQNFTNHLLNMNYTVLYAWCFSLLSMYEHDASKRVTVAVPYGHEDFPRLLRRDPVYLTLLKNKSRSVASIVADKYGWVPNK